MTRPANAARTAANTVANAANTVPNTNRSNPSRTDPRIGKTGTLTTDTNLRESPDPESTWLGTHYRGARIRISDVTSVTNSEGGTSVWFRIEITSFGTSVDPNNYGKDKDDYSQDTGWVNSFPYVYEGNRKYRTQLVKLD